LVKPRHSAFTLNSEGIVTNSQQIASPNFDDRPCDCDIDMVVIHNISLPPKQYGGDGIVALFTNQLDPNEHPYYAEIHTAKVSSHFLIRRDGALIQFVPCSKRAWHAGVSQWHGRERCNDFFENAQYKTLNSLIQSLKETYPIQHIVGHSDIAPGRKTDPGPFFDWAAQWMRRC